MSELSQAAVKWHMEPPLGGGQSGTHVPPLPAVPLHRCSEALASGTASDQNCWLPCDLRDSGLSAEPGRASGFSRCFNKKQSSPHLGKHPLGRRNY